MLKSPLKLIVMESLEKRQLLAAVPVGSEFLVSGAFGAEPAVAMDAAGNFVVTWSGLAASESGAHIYAQRFDSGGFPQGEKFRVSTNSADLLFAPSVAMDPTGAFLVAWSSTRAATWDIVARRFDAVGNPPGDEFRVNTSTTLQPRNPSVAMDAQGTAVIAWSEMYERDLRARRISAAGVPQGDPFIVNSTPGDHGRPSVAMRPDGESVITWFGNIPSDEGVLARRYDPSGVPQGEQVVLDRGWLGSPATAIDPRGNFVVVFADGNIYARRFTPHGAPLGPRFRVNTYTTGEQSFPRIAMNADGDFVVTWQSEGQDGSGWGVFAQLFDASGVPHGDEFRVNTYTTGLQHRPSIAMSNGEFVVAWHGDGPEGLRGTYAQRFAFTVDAVTVGHSQYEFLSTPHQVQFNFSRDVSASLAVNDLLVENLTTGQTLPASDFALAYDAISDGATFRYIGSAGGAAGVLPDGNYRITLLADGITGAGGQPMAADHVFNFFFLRGDANRDGKVNVDDFNTLTANFGKSGSGINFTKGDFNYDGMVNLADFNLLAGRFGIVLSPVASRIVTPDTTQDRSDDQLQDFLA